jgi:hypothetical protein
MSRRALRSVLAALAVAAGLTLATPNAEAAGGAAREPDAWSLALHLLAGLWEEGPGRIWAAQGWGIDPNGSQAPPPPPEATGDRGFGMDPNG